jgi:3-hydroxyacyl-[acyl-carrier-protein] dehydratase
MRYVLIDRFLELKRGVRARAVKCVTLGEPFLRDLDAYPPPLVLEALLQAGGALARASAPRGARTVLGKVDRADFPARAVAGDRIEILVEAILSRPEGTLCKGFATVDGRVVGTAEFMIVYVPPDLAPPPLPEEEERRRLLARALGLASEEEA